jgi:excisionase family DNA binding protein
MTGQSEWRSWDDMKPIESSLAPQSATGPDTATLSVYEAAQLLGVSPFTIYRLIQRGKLRALAGIRHKRIPKTEVNRFLSH